MTEPSDRLQAFVDTQGADLFAVLSSRGRELGAGAEDPEGCCYDLMEIAGAMLEIFNEMIPAVLAARDADIDTLQEVWWDIFHEFRNIDYHIHATIYPET